MQAQSYLDAFTARGVVLWREGETLRYKAPPAVLTPKVLEHLKQAKPKILPLLPEGQPIPEGPKTDEPVMRRYARQCDLQAVAEGRKVVYWPTLDVYGQPKPPVRVSKGVTTDNPEAWFKSTWEKFCLAWHQAEAARETGSTLYAIFSQKRELLFDNLWGVLEQAIDLPSAEADPYPGGDEGCRTEDELVAYYFWAERERERIRRGMVLLEDLPPGFVAELAPLALPA